METNAIVLFSGGQDSTTCLVWALERYSSVETVGFHYGQRHSVELKCRKKILDRISKEFPQWGPKLGEDLLLDLSVLGKVSDTALTSDKAVGANDEGLPNTFVPGRNVLFFTLAAAVALQRGSRVLIGGMCETDYSGYPDCRDETLRSLQTTLSLGLGQPVVIETPLMWLDKRQTWELASKVGGEKLVELIRVATHTCYTGTREKLHAWGYGCGDCPACALRLRGYEQFEARASA